MPISTSTLEILKRNGIQIPALHAGIHVHPNTAIEPPCLITKAVRWDTSLKVGAFSMLHSPGECVAVSIGRYCSIAPDVVLGANEHAMEWMSTSSLLENPNLYGWSSIVDLVGRTACNVQGYPFEGSIRPISIGHDVWIGRGAFIKGGVSIGDGAVIAAKSVVVKDVPAYAVVGGNPARQIRDRFEEKIVCQLKDLCWWQYSIFDLMSASPNNLPLAIDQIRSAINSGQLKPYAPRVLDAGQLNT